MRLATTVLCIVLLPGCSSLLPSRVTDSGTPWETFAAARQTFASVEIGKTTVTDLKGMGVDLDTLPNVKHLTYLDVARKFGLVNHTGQNIVAIPDGVKKLVKAGDKGRGYELNAGITKSKREGNFMLDWMNFRKTTHKTGWEFKVLLIVIDEKIEYVLHSGTPAIDETERKKNPLGPLQTIDSGAIVTMGIKSIK